MRIKLHSRRNILPPCKHCFHSDCISIYNPSDGIKQLIATSLKHSLFIILNTHWTLSAFCLARRLTSLSPPVSLAVCNTCKGILGTPSFDKYLFIIFSTLLVKISDIFIKTDILSTNSDPTKELTIRTFPMIILFLKCHEFGTASDLLIISK